jgi:CHAD domain-containing protein
MTAADNSGLVHKGALQRWAKRRTGRLQQRLVQAHKQADTPQQKHRVRILAKRLRYGAEALRELLPRHQADACIAQASQLQGNLGKSRDVAQAGALVAALALDPHIEAYLQGVEVGFKAGLGSAP